MGEAVGIRGRFKTKKERYPEIQKMLIEGLSKYLEPDDYPEIWDNYFNIKDDCLELCFESYGHYGRAEEWIRQVFQEKNKDVTVEFGVLVYDEYGYAGDKYVLADEYGSRSKVVVVVEDNNNSRYLLEDEPAKCSPTNCGDAYFKGNLRNVLLQHQKSDWKKVLMQDFAVVSDGNQESIQLAENLHVGAKVGIKVIRYSQNDWGGSSLTLQVYSNEKILGETIIFESSGLNLELIYKILKENQYSVNGVVTRIVPLSKRRSSAKRPAIQMKIVADQIEMDDLSDGKVLIYDTVKELCDFLVRSVKDDYENMGGCYGDDVFDELYWGEHNRKMQERKEEFIEDVIRNVKNISDIKTISVEREYCSWGDSDEWIVNNDTELCEYAETIMAAKGDERKVLMEEMKKYIQIPNQERRYGEFTRDMEIRYVWKGDDKELLKLCKCLVDGECPEFECGREYKEIDLETKQYTEYVEIQL